MDLSCVTAVGLQWGDEGKGKIVDWLAADAHHVARFQGGHNAGHTIVANGQKLVLHLVPSGILQQQCHCHIGQGVVLSLPALLEEIQTLSGNGIETDGRLTVSADCSLILPYHQALDQAREKSSNKIGTTLRGIGPAHEDKVGRRAVRLRHVLQGDFSERLQALAKRANCELVHLHSAEPLDEKEVEQQLREQAEQVRKYTGNVAAKLSAAREKGEKILLEASQGALLDVEQGSYPYVTSAHCIAAASIAGIGVDLRPEVIGIAKCYTTRVGNGSFPTELSGKEADLISEAGEEFGATTVRKRRIGWIDIPALRHALSINGCKNIILTKLDILGLLDKVKICTEYEGHEDSQWFSDDATISNLKPRYREHPSWGQMGVVGDKENLNLPDNCRDYIDQISKLTGTSISAISFGKDREDTRWLAESLR